MKGFNREVPILTATTTNEDYQIRLDMIRNTIDLHPPIKRTNSSATGGDCSSSEYTLIGDVVRYIRRRVGPDYLFTESQIREVLRREPSAQIKYLGDYIWQVLLLPKKKGTTLSTSK